MARSFLITWLAAMQISWNKRKFFHKKRVKSPQDFLFCTQTWPPINCFVNKYYRRDIMWKRSKGSMLAIKYEVNPMAR